MLLHTITYQWSWLALCSLDSRGTSKTLKDKEMKNMRNGSMGTELNSVYGMIK